MTAIELRPYPTTLATPAPEVAPEAFPLDVTRAIHRGGWPADPDDRRALAAVARIRWSERALRLADPADRELAARATAHGAALCYAFANFYVIASHPCEASLRYVNGQKGRPPLQVGSITTTRDRLPGIWDWAQLPAGLDRETVLAIVHDFYARGPFGFRGPAAAGIPDHLTSIGDGVRTTQVIAAGYACPSNALLARTLELAREDFLMITSANISHNLTGNAEEPAHYTMRGIQRDFGHFPGFIMVAHADEAAARARYRAYAPQSTTILSFHTLARTADGRPALVVDRHGSLHLDDVRAILARHGFDAVLGPKAQARLPVRGYEGA